MVRRKDKFWEYAEDLKGRFICKFCNKDYPGGVARVKSHLSQQPGRDIACCPSVPDDVQAAALFAIRESGDFNKKRKTTSFSSQSVEQDSTSGLHQTTVPAMCHKKDKEFVDRALAQAFFMNNISFNIIQDASFIEFCRALSNYGVGYSVPSYSTLRTKLVHNAKVEVEQYVSEIKDYWVRMGSGCTLMSDGWTDLKGQSFINMIAYSPKGTIFLKSFEESSERKTGMYLRNLFCNIIEEIGAKNVVQIITDNASNYESAGQMVMELYPHIYKTRCAAHGVQLLLKDIYKEVDWVQRVFDDAKEIVDYMYKYTTVLALMRKMTNERELKRPCKTRFAYHFLMLQSILEVEDELRQMIASPEWRNMKYSTSEMAKKITNTIQGTTFWSDGSEVISALEPIIRVLRLVDGEGSTTGYLYEAMERAKESLKHRCDNNQSRYIKLWELFNSRRDTNIIHNVHAVAAFLNPLLMSSGKIRYDSPEVRKGLLFVVEKMFDTSDERRAFGTQITEYNTQSSDIFTTLARDQMETIHPRIWWLQNGGPIPIVQKVAIRILSQPCSSSSCERNWSAFEAAQTKRRNRLTPSMLEDLIYIRMNSKMKTNCGDLEKCDTKIINLEQLGELLEYVDDGREELEKEDEITPSREDILFDELFGPSTSH